MAYKDVSITPKLIDSARKEFRLNGFERASVNTICRNAKVTTGALYKRFATKEELFSYLVEEPAEELKLILIDQSNCFYLLPKEKQLSSAFNSWQGEDRFIEYIYENKEDFLMIFTLSSGTRYEHYIDELTWLITKSTILFIEENHRITIDGDMLEDLVHILVSSYITGILKPLLCNMTSKKTEMYIKYIKRFFYIGWKDLLGL